MMVVWGYCLATGLLVAECSGDNRQSIQKMAEASVGRTAGNALCATFLASNYLLMVAYICQATDLISGLPVVSTALSQPFFDHHLKDPHLAPIIFTALAGCGSLWGPKRLVEDVNTSLVGLIAITFVGLLCIGMPHVNVSLLEYTPDASALPSMVPVALCALAFQNVVPAVSKNLGGDSQKIRSSLVLGSGLPLLMCECPRGEDSPNVNFLRCPYLRL